MATRNHEGILFDRVLLDESTGQTALVECKLILNTVNVPALIAGIRAGAPSISGHESPTVYLLSATEIQSSVRSIVAKEPCAAAYSLREMLARSTSVRD
jgi:hypothetical protein